MKNAIITSDKFCQRSPSFICNRKSTFGVIKLYLAGVSVGPPVPSSLVRLKIVQQMHQDLKCVRTFWGLIKWFEI